ncbi:mRNA cleavage and polyadenylation factor subunit [Tulasnella sp. 330]|nr:mRNA cleavage and polyadenylation factor subunit [Tulasnella sp. 330]
MSALTPTMSSLRFDSRTPSPTTSSPSSSTSGSGSLPTPPGLHQNSIDPAARWLVQKYGGTSVGKFAERIAETIVPTYLDQHKVAIVCSARSGSTKALGTTNLLLRAASEALKPVSVDTPAVTPGTQTPSRNPLWGRNSPSPPRRSSVSTASSRATSPTRQNSLSSLTHPSFNATVDLIRSEHIKAARELIKHDALLKDLEAEIDHDCEGLRGYLFAAQVIDEISPRSKDNIVGVGERLACKLVAAVLQDRGIDAEVVTLETIVLDALQSPSNPNGTLLDAEEAFSDGEALDQSFYDRLADALGHRIRQCPPHRVPVITGFFGPVPGSLLRQIGRGYTDLLAALLAVGLDASELQIWKEVDGIFTADPRKVLTARLIPIISPEEAVELTYYGSEVIHPFTMEQVIRRKIPIRIKNVENPEGGGTVIHPNPEPEVVMEEIGLLFSGLNGISPLKTLSQLDSPTHSTIRQKKLPTAVTIKDHILVLNIHSNRKTISHGFLAKIFGTLDRFGVSVDLISTSEVHVSMAIEDTIGKKAVERLVRELKTSGTVTVHPDMAILSLVGKQMKHMIGIAGRMFSTLAEGNVNIEMISQGASEINISCVIEGRDATKALNIIHQSCLQITPEAARGRELLSASGVEYATFLNLTPSSSIKNASGTPSRVITNLAVARSNLLRIFEVRQEPAPLPSFAEAEAHARNGASKLGTEAVEGEVEMDEGGEGFVNMAQVRALPEGLSITPSTVTRLFLLREHRLHGIVTGIQRVKTIASSEDGMDRVLISFKDAKISLMEWSEVQRDLMTVSIHTYERTPQLLSMNSPTWRSSLRTDSLNRCAALTLPRDALAILPFHSSAELEMMEQERTLAKDVPYAPSFVLDLTEVDGRIRNVLDMVFVPGFNNSTIAVAFQTTQTWTGRLNEFKDTVTIFMITLDIFTRTYPVIGQIHGLPYDVLYMVACPATIGGLLIVTANAILHVDQASRTVGVAVNGWANRVSTHVLSAQPNENKTPLDLQLEGSCLTFVNDTSILLSLCDGEQRSLKMHMEGRAVSRLELSPPLGMTGPAAVVCVSDDEHVFVGSTSGPSTLLKAVHIEMIVELEKEDVVAPASADLDMELDEDIYGDVAAQIMAQSTSGPATEKIVTLQLALRDTLPGHGIISDMTFGLMAEDGQPELIACTGVGKLGGLTRFTKQIPTRTKRKLPSIGGRQGIWSICVKRSSNANMDRANSDGRDTIIISTNSTPAPGLSRIPACHSFSLFSDKTGLLALPASDPDGAPETEKLERLEDILDTDRGTQWAVLYLKSGELQIRNLPQLEIVFSTPEVRFLSPSLTHNSDKEMRHSDNTETGFEIQSICLAMIGESELTKPHLTVLTTSGFVASYEVLPLPVQTTRRGSAQKVLSIHFIKTLVHLLGRPSNPVILPRRLIPFSTMTGNGPLSGVFCTGDQPFWLLSVNWSPLRLYPTANNTIHALAPSSIFGSEGDFLVHNEDGPALVQWVGDVQLGLELPYRPILIGRQYTAVIFDPATKHVIAVSSQKARFALYDEEGKSAWSVDGPGISEPVCESCSLELFSPDTWTTIDGYEFAQNEFVNVAESVSLETLSAEKGEKDFIVVGTTIYRGEDLAVKGATYVFEVVEVVPEPGSAKRRNKLKLLCRDEAKGPVTAVCGINGYLISSMGQKVYVRAFDLDERLIGMAFLDVGLYVTSIRTLKNLILISDAVKSVWFVCFQEDPFKLIVLAKDFEAVSTTNTNFFFGSGQDLAFISTDENGIIRMYEYNPLDPESNNGQRLLCRTEFDGQEEHKAVLTVARRSSPSIDMSVEKLDANLAQQAQSVLVCATLAGSISLLSPVESARFKRLALLQGQLVKNVQHVGGLNPKGYRTVRNEKVSRPLSKGILDADLLRAFIDLELGRQEEMTRQIGTARDLITHDLSMIWQSW